MCYVASEDRYKNRAFYVVPALLPVGFEIIIVAIYQHDHCKKEIASELSHFVVYVCME